MVIPPPLLLIVGPTGVGKTAVAARLARSVPMEVVSADSRQVYRGMDAATGKPTSDERKSVTHHLLDLIEPGERYHAARFRLDAAQAIEAIRAAGRLPVVVGGTGLYVRALLRGLDPAPPADPALRAELEEIARTRGPAVLHERLSALDPDRAARLHPNDRVRIIRAIETHGRRTASAGSWARDGALARRDVRAPPGASRAEPEPRGTRAKNAGRWDDGRGPAAPGRGP